MIIDPKIFYTGYLHNYHKFKVSIYFNILQDIGKFEDIFFTEKLDKENKEAFHLTLKSELRQTYFHAIESFFELFFCLLKDAQPNFDDANIMIRLSNSKWQENYRKIERIASGDLSLDFFNNEIEFRGYKVTVGHYLFYFGLFDVSKYPSDFLNKINLSISAIQKGIKLLAVDFVDREEYNSYKHGLRVIPALKELMLLDPNTLKVNFRFDLSDSVSFYAKTRDKDEVKIRTKNFDTDRNVAMIMLASNLISSIVYSRKISFFKELVKEKEIKIGFYGDAEIEQCAKTNLQLDDLVYTIRRADS